MLRLVTALLTPDRRMDLLCENTHQHRAARAHLRWDTIHMDWEISAVH